MNVCDSGMGLIPFLHSLKKYGDFPWGCLPYSYCLSRGAIEHLPSFSLRCPGLWDYHSKHPPPTGSQKGRDFIPVGPFGIFRKSNLIPLATTEELHLFLAHCTFYLGCGGGPQLCGCFLWWNVLMENNLSLATELFGAMFSFW